MPLGPSPVADPRATPDDDLAWDAFRYVADAMTRLEVDAFEQRLLEHQDVREAVAAAVDQFGALAIVGREVATARSAVIPLPARFPRFGRARLVALGTAAASVLLAIWWGVMPRSRLDPADPAAELARAWSDLRQGSTAPEGTLPLQPDHDAVGPDGEPGDPALAPAEVAEAPAETALPSWMLAAVVAPDPNLETPAPEDN